MEALDKQRPWGLFEVLKGKHVVGWRRVFTSQHELHDSNAR